MNVCQRTSEIGFEEFDQARTFLNQVYPLETTQYDNPKAVQKQAKEALKCFLEYLFSGSNVKKIDDIPPAQYCVFYLKNGNREYDKYQFLVSASCHYASCVIKNNTDVIQLHNDTRNRRAVGVFIISKILSGKRVEWIFSSKTAESHSDSFWDCWENDCSAIERYDTYIHPSIRVAVSKIIDRREDCELFTILDIGGGKGALAEKLLSLMPFYSKYILLERNRVSVEVAREVVGHWASVVHTDIVAEDHFFQDEAKIQNLKANSVSIAIACGILARGVLDGQAEALRVLQTLYAYIKPGGFVIISGYTASLIEAKELRATGFEVIYMSLPDLIGVQFYVARKRA